MREASGLGRRALLAGTAGGAALAAEARPARAQGRPPNILYVMADDMGYADLSCYGRTDYGTPSIDRLAAGGMRFLQAYANSPVCSATRTALITGRYQYRLPIGLEEPLPSAGTRPVGLPPEHPTLPSLLRRAGYGTTLVGKWHLGKLPRFGPLQSGYDRFFGFRGGSLDYFTHKYGAPETDTADLWDGDAPVERAGYLTDLLGDRAVREIEGYARSRQPFLMSLHFSAPHWPWEGPDDEAESRRLRSIMHYDGGTMRTYAAMMVRLDEQVGRVLAALERNGLAEDTIVVFTSDNGGERFAKTWPFSGRKTELLEGGLRIPAIVRWPARLPAGVTTEQVGMSMDWLPTLLAAAGIAPDPGFPPDGMDLLPVLTGRAPVAERTLFWRYKYNAQRAVRSGDWKWLQILDQTFLFNVVEDPMERGNLKRRHGEVYDRLVAAYDAWDATMLPFDPASNTDGFTADQLADHFGVRRPVPVGQPGPRR